MLEPQLCAEVFVPLIEGEPGEGSGYTLAPGWVLTAYHVLFGDAADEREQAQLHIVWSQAPKDAEGEPPQVRVPRSRIAWAHPALDLALIRCPLPKLGHVPLSAGDLLALEVPQSEQTPWKSYGFLSGFGDSAGQRDCQDPSGILGIVNLDRTDHSLTVTRGRMEDRDAWAGFSGAPVFTGPRLLGLVRQANPGRNGASLRVTFLPQALEAEAGPEGKTLAEQLGLDLAEDYAQALRAWFLPLLPRTLGGPGEMCDKAIAAFNDTHPNARVAGAEPLAEALLAAAPAERVAFVEALEQRLPDPSPAERDALRELALLMLGLVFPGHQAAMDIRAQRRRGQPIIRGQTADELSTEGAESAADVRPANVQYRADGPFFPNNVSPNQARAGLDDEQQQATKDIAQLLLNKTVPGDCAELVAALWSEIYRGGGAGRAAARQPSAADKLRGLNRRIAKQPQRFYALLPRQTNKDEQAAWARLKPEFPDLDLIRLQPHTDPDTTDLIADLEAIILRTLK